MAIALENALLCQKLTAAFGGPNFLTEKQYKFIENWEVESYRRSVSLKGATAGRLQNRICVVTGGAQGFGLGIAEYLAENGGIIVVADLNLEGAQATADELCKKYGAKRAFAVGVNVSDEESVEAMVNTIAKAVGGIDLFVSNAGVVRSGSVMELTLKDWNFVTNINYTGYFLCCKHAARLMSKQIVDGEGRWTDIVQGGGARIPKISELASKVFNRPVAITRTYGAEGRADVVDSPAALVPLGLARFGKQSDDIENQNHPHNTSGRFKRFITTIINW